MKRLRGMHKRADNMVNRREGLGRALACMVLGLVSVAVGREWTLDELVGEALRTSREVETVRSEMDKVDAQIREAYGSALPVISATANYQYSWESFNPMAGMMDFSGMGAVTDSAALAPLFNIMMNPASTDEDSTLAASIYGLYMGMGALAGLELTAPSNTIMLGLSLQQPIYAQGKVTIGLKVAKQFKDGLLCKYEAARQKAKTEATKLFYAALLAQEAIRIRREAHTLAQESHRLTVARFTVGKTGEVDTFATRLAVEQATMEMRDAESKYRVTCEALIKTTGITESVEEFSVRGEFPTEPFEITLEEAVRRMRAGNKTIGQLQSGEAIQEQLVKFQKTDYRPLVYCGASLNKYLMFDEFGDIDWGAEQSADKSVFIGASYTLFNGFQRRQKVKQANEDLRQFQLTKEQALDGLEIAVRSTWETMETNRKQLASAQSLVELARKGHSLAQRAYEVGLSTLLELQKAENNLNGAQMALNAARFSFHSAMLDLKFLMGDITMDNSARLQ